MEPSPAAKRLLEEALLLVDKAGLDDLLKFVTANRLQEASGLSSGAIYNSFRSPVQAARIAVLEALECVNDAPAELSRLLSKLGVRLGAGDESALDEIADEIARHAQTCATGSRKAAFAATLLVAAVMGEDREAAEHVVKGHPARNSQYRAFYTDLLQVCGREPVEEFDEMEIGILSNAVADGVSLRMRLDDEIDPQFLTKAIRAVWAGTTRKKDSVDDTLDHRIGLRSTSLTPLAEEKRAEIGAAVRELYSSEGWGVVTISSVAAATGISRNTVRHHFGDRDGLAVAVWSGFVPAFERLANIVDDVPASAAIERFLLAFAERAREHPAATESLLASVHLHSLKRRDQGGRAHPDDLSDPRNTVPLPPLLARVIQQHRDELRPGFADTPGQAVELAAFLVNSTLLRAITRPAENASELVSYVCNVCITGLVKPAP